LDIPFEEKIVAPGPPGFETYAPWYLKLNPMGTVPTLVDGDKNIPDSHEIMNYAVSHLSEKNIIPAKDEEKEAMERWIENLRQIPIRELSYGADKTRKAGQRVNKMRLRNLKKRKKKNPALAVVYENKIADIEGFSERAVTPEIVTQHNQQLNEYLDELNELLKSQTWLAGSSYSLADTVWTVGIARFFMLNLDPLKNRDNLAQWYARVKDRPSFKSAQIWEKFEVGIMLAVLLKKYRLNLLLIGTALAAVCTGICWLACS